MIWKIPLCTDDEGGKMIQTVLNLDSFDQINKHHHRKQIVPHSNRSPNGKYHDSLCLYYRLLSQTRMELCKSVMLYLPPLFKRVYLTMKINKSCSLDILINITKLMKPLLTNVYFLRLIFYKIKITIFKIIIINNTDIWWK